MKRKATTFPRLNLLSSLKSFIFLPNVESSYA
jgi:hypothetical protein